MPGATHHRSSRGDTPEVCRTLNTLQEGTQGVSKVNGQGRSKKNQL